MSIEEAIALFRRAAIEKGEFAEPASRDHQLYDEMVLAWQVLESFGGEGRQAFAALLRDESPNVRTWVASQLLALGDESGLAILEADAKEGGSRGFDSKMVLQEWRGGRLKPPFGRIDA